MSTVSDPAKLLEAMQEARDAVLGASVEEVIQAHAWGMQIIPSDIVTRPALLVPHKMFTAIKERLADDEEGTP